MKNKELILNSLSKSKFRSSFHLKLKDKNYVKEHGMTVIRQHANDFITKRLAPDIILNDGKQTPMRNHPVFIAQHATATCCRGCLEKWYHIPKNRALTNEEITDIVDLIMLWITKEMQNNSITNKKLLK
jgi:exodeoxyribonuclease V alpha subunit